MTAAYQESLLDYQSWLTSSQEQIQAASASSPSSRSGAEAAKALKATGEAAATASSSKDNPLWAEKKVKSSKAAEVQAAGATQDPAQSDMAAALLMLQGATGTNPRASRFLGKAVRYRRSWSIQDALDMHTHLCEQNEEVARQGETHIEYRKTQFFFAQLEVEEALMKAVHAQPSLLSNAGQVQDLARHLRRVSEDLLLATRIKQGDESYILDQLRDMEASLELSRAEVKEMKEAIDDTSLRVAPEDGQFAFDDPQTRKFFYCTNCKVGGYGQRFCELLLKRPEWRVYPSQLWFSDGGSNFYCPLGKRLVDFTDETHFSRTSMYIKGRGVLEDKSSLSTVAPDFLPETYIIEGNLWRGNRAPPPDSQCSDLPWFVKQAGKHRGTAVEVCRKASECLSLCKPGIVYVVQQHVENAVLTDDGCKCHIQVYILLLGVENGMTWKVFTYQDGYLAVSPNSWTSEDISKDTQVTVHRTQRASSWRHWPEAYPLCKAAAVEVLRRVTEPGQLEGRPPKRQFELISADFILDLQSNVRLLGFNTSPLLRTTEEEPSTLNDVEMVTAALDIVFPREGSGQGLWDFAAQFQGPRPAPAPSRGPGI